MKPSLAARPQIAQRQHPLEGRERPGVGRQRGHGAETRLPPARCRPARAPVLQARTRRALDQLDQALHRRIAATGSCARPTCAPSPRSRRSSAPSGRRSAGTAGRSGPWSRTWRRPAPRCRRRAPTRPPAPACRKGRAGLVGFLVAGLQVDEADLERRHRHRPHDAGAVVAGLDDGAGKPRHADAVGAHLHRDHARRPAPARGSPSARSTWCRRRKCGRPRCRAPTPACRPAPPRRSGRGRASRRSRRRDRSRLRSAVSRSPSKSMSAGGVRISIRSAWQ